MNTWGAVGLTFRGQLSIYGGKSYDYNHPKLTSQDITPLTLPLHPTSSLRGAPQPRYGSKMEAYRNQNPSKGHCHGGYLSILYGVLTSKIRGISSFVNFYQKGPTSPLSVKLGACSNMFQPCVHQNNPLASTVCVTKLRPNLMHPNAAVPIAPCSEKQVSGTFQLVSCCTS